MGGLGHVLVKIFLVHPILYWTGVKVISRINSLITTKPASSFIRIVHLPGEASKVEAGVVVLVVSSVGVSSLTKQIPGD